jgi:hypothetical protein
MKQLKKKQLPLSSKMRPHCQRHKRPYNQNALGHYSRTDYRSRRMCWRQPAAIDCTEHKTVSSIQLQSVEAQQLENVRVGTKPFPSKDYT